MSDSSDGGTIISLQQEVEELKEQVIFWKCAFEAVVRVVSKK